MSGFSRSRGLFVTGTDTEVGKTIVTGGLAAILREAGLDVGVMKPAETGCEVKNGELLPADADFLGKMSGVNEPREKVVPYRFKEPLAPAVAAELEGVNIEIEKIMENFKEISATHEFILVEGAGGLLAPLSRDFLILDLIKLLQLPSLIVSRADLGTINHTLLTLRCLQAEKLPVAGIVINNLSPAKSLAAKTNPEIIAKLTKVPIWGILPCQKEIRSDKSIEKTVIKLIEEHLDLTPLFNLAKNKQKIIE